VLFVTCFHRNHLKTASQAFKTENLLE